MPQLTAQNFNLYQQIWSQGTNGTLCRGTWEPYCVQRQTQKITACWTETVPIYQHPRMNKEFEAAGCVPALPQTLNILFLGWMVMIVYHEKCISHPTD